MDPGVDCSQKYRAAAAVADNQPNSTIGGKFPLSGKLVQVMSKHTVEFAVR